MLSLIKMLAHWRPCLKECARTHIIEMLLSEAKRVGMGGINLDFEALQRKETAFYQFVRELSVMCREQSGFCLWTIRFRSISSFYNRKEQGIVPECVIIMRS